MVDRSDKRFYGQSIIIKKVVSTLPGYTITGKAHSLAQCGTAAKFFQSLLFKSVNIFNEYAYDL